MANFEDFIDALKEGAKELAKETFDGFEDQAKQDSEDFIEKSKEDLKRWTKLLAQGDINEQDFSDLVLAKKALAEMFALRQTGLTLIKVENFRKGFINLVVDTAFEVFL
ncbi:hypothetical protein [Aeromonas sp. 602200]|uniref:hypothetical protein n=1 Tax=Aeromonas sp. 602200 TaxID=2712040 RepID=UPI003BA0AACF